MATTTKAAARKATITQEQAFTLGGAQLRELAGAGDNVAQGEIDRRKAKKAAKATAKATA
jgi:hypothetical protein